jgi:DNA-directed RNA polymerase subunit alpha
MTTSAAEIDVAALLQALDFKAADLTKARAAVQASAEARAAAEKAANDGGTGERAALARGTAHYVLGRLREASAALAQAGDSPQARLVRGRAALEDGDPAGAAAALAPLSGTAVSASPLELEIVAAKALSGDSDGAKAAAKALSGEKADSLTAEGIALESEGKHKEARAKFEAAVQADARHARALFRLAHALDLAGEDDAAIDAYRRCAALDPAPVNALINLGLLLEDHDKFAEAEVLYRRVLAADPNHAHARLYLKDVVSAQTQTFDEDVERKEDRRNQILRTPISEFELSVRSRNCLAKMEITTLGDLITKTEAELLAYKNFGETSLQEIKDILAQKGLRLGMGPADGIPLATREEAEAELDAMFGGRDEDEGDEDEAEEGGDPRSTPIDQLGLSIRARRAVEALELETVGDLADRTAEELLANKAFTPTSLGEVTKKLAELGLSLKGTPPVPPAE